MTDHQITLTVGIFSPLATIVVLWLSPRMTFGVWKLQKLREQQLSIAERYAKLAHIAHFDHGPQHFFEERILVMLAAALFQGEELKRGLKRLGETVPKRDFSPESLESLS